MKRYVLSRLAPRVVSHQDIMHNVPLAPPLLKTVLGLPTPLLATLLHV